MLLTRLQRKQHSALTLSVADLLDVTKSIDVENKALLKSLSTRLQQQIEACAWNQGDRDAFQTFAKQLDNFIQTSRTTEKVRRIIKSLHFKQIKERQSEIKEAHTATFEWIFQTSTAVNFVPWLISGDGIYWIAGKAGSGKSTLMKFLQNHAQTRANLRRWAGNRNLIVASHFFWSAGTTMQKSQNGLFRTLLCQILIQCPGVIPLVCGERWDDDTFDLLEGWTRTELLNTFKRLATFQQLPSRCCLFVDGLDEYNGDHRELLNVLNTISQSPDIKLCVSSRPWNDFIDVFGHSHWKLYVQDLTANDIRLYVKDNLEQDSRFQYHLSRDYSATQSLIRQICAKADGVFLWVYLVVRSLLRGLSNRDEVFDLHQRLHKLPGDLERYFEHMMNSIENIYQVQTARIFKTIVTSEGSLPLIDIHFLDMERYDPSYAMGDKITPLSQEQLRSTLDEKKWQLNARCRDLLQISTDAQEGAFFKHSVKFLHRTVIDFFRTKAMDDLLTIRSGPGE